MELVERGAALQTLREQLQAAAVSGRVLLLAGEAGAGKTSLLRTLAASADGASVWWGACDALDTPHPLAPLHDIVRSLRPGFAPLMDGPRPALFAAVLDALSLPGPPRLVVIEDAHWADEATLDLLTHLGRRIERTRALLAISFRDDEVGPRHPLRRVLGNLPPDARHTVHVPRLSAAAVRSLAERAGRAATGLHEATQGNAFFVAELLRDGGVGLGLPSSVRDLVLARYARLPAPAQALLDCAALVPGRIERTLLDAVVAPAPSTLETVLASGLLLAEGGALQFRHELARVAIASALAEPVAQALHARLLLALGRQLPLVPARLVHHAAGAQDAAAVGRWAPVAADEAQGRGAHRESHAHWQTALRSGQTDEAERRRWLEQSARAALQVGEMGITLDAYTELREQALARGDRAEAARLRAQQAQPLSTQLNHPAAREAVAEALAELAPLPLSPAHASVWTRTALLRMLDRDTAEAVWRGRMAHALALALGDAETRDLSIVATGAALLFEDYPAGVALLQNLADHRAQAGNRYGQAMALSMLGSGSGELLDLPRACSCLTQSVTLCEDNDWNHQYADAWLALCEVQRGNWAAAAALATRTLRETSAVAIAHLMAWLALARLRLRRGDPGVDEALAQARAMAAGSDTLQRMAPYASTAAEAAWMRGDTAAVAAVVQPALTLARAKRHTVFTGELAVWLHRTGLPLPAELGPLRPPHALELQGRWAEAAAAWTALGCPYEAAQAQARGEPSLQRKALLAFESLDARPAAEALRTQLRRAGERGIARGARARTRAHPAGLTVAEAAVLRALADGLRNAEIAARLHRSVRTVDHHVAAVLAKLGVGTRLAAVQRAQAEGWLAAGKI